MDFHGQWCILHGNVAQQLKPVKLIFTICCKPPVTSLLIRWSWVRFPPGSPNKNSHLRKCVGGCFWVKMGFWPYFDHYLYPLTTLNVLFSWCFSALLAASDTKSSSCLGVKRVLLPIFTYLIWFLFISSYRVVRLNDSMAAASSTEYNNCVCDCCFISLLNRSVCHASR